MKVAAIYDIHGNLPALEAVLAEIERAAPDLIVVGGDVASGPMPKAALERLMTLGERARFVCGNADRELVNCFDGLALSPNIPAEVRELTTWAAQQLERKHRDFLASFAAQVVLNVDGLGDVLFCHGSPRSDEEILTAATPDQRLQAALTGVEQPVVICGHTHMQFDRQCGKIRIVNAGSVGMPYGEPGAYWLWLGPEAMLRRTPYDLEEAARLIRASGYPQAEDFADNNVLQPPTAAEAIEIFERMAAS
ncbi:MAG TPA: metallophosphoesterase family protein [Ktedonobacterales bacterium]|nr:metallophosphoesterase family protein [Ktedonobacterales bacterium]